MSKFWSLTSFLIIWSFVFIAIHIIHMKFFIVDVVFYATLKDVVISSIIMLLIYRLFLKSRLNFSQPEFILTVLLGFSGGYIFSITVPTVIDRSLSAYILEKFMQRGGRLQEDALNKIFIGEFINESRLMEIRLQEALSSGTLIVQDGCIVLTSKGQRIASMTSFYRKTFLPKKRLLLGEVTDDLTNPFRKSPNEVDYICESN